MNLFEIIRAAILAIGWPFLIIGSIFVLFKQITFNKKFGQLILGKIMLITAAGWIITMFSLAISATLLMFENIILGVKVVLPIFLIWFIIMITLIAIVRRWNIEALRMQKFYNQLTEGIKKIVSGDFNFRIEINSKKHDELNTNTILFNKMVAEIKLSREKLKKSNWAQVKELEDKIYELEKVQSNLEEKLRNYI